MPSNNDFISDIAKVPRASQKTNNQLLETISTNTTNGSVVRQGAISDLDEFATEADIVQKVNEITTALRASGVIEN